MHAFRLLRKMRRGKRSFRDLSGLKSGAEDLASSLPSLFFRSATVPKLPNEEDDNHQHGITHCIT